MKGNQIKKSWMVFGKNNSLTERLHLAVRCPSLFILFYLSFGSSDWSQMTRLGSKYSACQGLLIRRTDGVRGSDQRQGQTFFFSPRLSVKLKLRY